MTIDNEITVSLEYDVISENLLYNSSAKSHIVCRLHLIAHVPTDSYLLREINAIAGFDSVEQHA